MAAGKVWVPYAATLDAETAQAGTAVHVAGISAVAVNSNLLTRAEITDGAVYPTFGSLVAGAPAATFDTSELKTLLDECGLTGMLIDDGGTGAGVLLYAQKATLGGTRDAVAAGTHVKWTIANGLLYLQSLDLPHQGTARLTAAISAIKSGATAPVSFSSSANLPSGVYPAGTAKWTLGPVKFNTTTIDGLNSARIDFGVAIEAVAADSDVYPTHVFIRSINPVITLTGMHVDVVGTLTVDGAYYTASQVVLYAKKRDEGGTFVSDATAEHIKFTLGKCRVDWDSVAGDPRSVTMRITPWYTAGASPVSPITIATASAIT